MTNKDIVLLAHNIRSLWNVGSFFRTADAFAVSKMYLTGYTATPPRREISKTAIGAEEWIAWECQKDPLTVIAQLKDEGYAIVALEKTDDSANVADVVLGDKTCLILGHEVQGVSKELLSASDSVVHISMLGKKESLNVSVALGVALSHLRKR